MTYIGYGAFSDCPCLTSVTSYLNVPFETYCFEEYEEEYEELFIDATLYVPSASIRLYQKTYPWKNFKNILPIGDMVTMQVVNDGNEDMTDKVSIVWHDGDGKQIGTGKFLGGIEDDAKYYYSITLDEELGRIYREVKMCPIETEEDTIVCQLQRIERVALYGTVMAEGLPVAKADVKVRQWLNGRYEYADSTMTDAQGKFSLQAYNDSTEVTVSYDGFMDSQVKKASLGMEANLGTVYLERVHGKVLIPDFTYQAAVMEGTSPTIQNFYSDVRNVSYVITNDTKQTQVENFNIQQNGDIVIANGVETGDELTITATSMNGKFADVSVTATFDESDTMHVALPLVELGGVYVEYETKVDDQLLVLVYDAEGKLVSRATSSTSRVSFTGLEAGSYSVVTIGYDGSIGSVSDMSGLAAIGLEEGVDYTLNGVTVRDGFLSTVVVESVPEWESDKVNYMAGNTSYLPNKSQMPFGGVGYVTMAARVDFHEELREDVNDARLVVDIPDGCEMVAGSVVIDNKVSPYTLDGSTLAIPVPKDALDSRIRFCVRPNTYGTFTSTAYAEFDYHGEHTQSVGTAVFDVARPEIYVPGETAVATIPVRGIALPKAEVDVYDNGYLIGSTKALADGNWGMDCELYKPYHLSTHDIHAKITAANGVTSTTDSRECLLDKAMVKAKTVTMTYYNDWLKKNLSVVFDFETGKTSDNSYQFYTATDFTFVADLSHNDTTHVKGVTFYVQTSDNGVSKLNGVFDERLGRWVAVKRFGSNSLPTNLNIKIDEAESLALVDRDEIDDNLNGQQAAFDEAKAKFADIEAIFDRADEDGDPSAFARLLSLLEKGSYSAEEYNALIGEIQRIPLPSQVDEIDESQLDEEYKRLMEEYAAFMSKYGKDSIYAALGINASIKDMEWLSTSFTGEIMNGKNIKLYSFEQLPSIDEDELLALGYSVISTTDGSKIYYLETDDEMVYIDGRTSMKYRLAIVRDANGKKRISIDISTIMALNPKYAPFILLRDLVTEMVNHDGYDQALLQGQIDRINPLVTSVDDVYKKFLSWKDEAIVGWFEKYSLACNTLSSALELNKVRYAKEFEKLAQTVAGAPDAPTARKMAELIIKEQACERSAQWCKSSMKKVTTAYEWVKGYIKQLPPTPAITVGKGMKLTGQLALGGFGLFYELIDMYSDLRNARDNYMKWIGLLDAVDRKVRECPIPRALALQQQIRSDARDLVHNYDRIFTAEIQAMELDAVSLVAAIAGAISGPGAAIGEGSALALDIASGIYGIYSEASKALSINGKFKRLAENYKREIEKIRCGLPDPPYPPSPEPPTPYEEEDEYWILYIFKYIYPIHDPSGYVYEAVPSNRVEGVTASIYYDEDGPRLWDAADFSQVNPIVTDETGLYAWDVPQGMWQVRFEKDGYETQQTEWLPVPPPQLEINIPMQQAIAPVVTKARGAESGIWLTFSKYMKPETLTKNGRVSATCNGKAVKGEVEMLDLEEDPYNKHEYASRVKFVPDVAFNTTDEVIITVKKEVESYASMPMEADFVQRVTIEPEIKDIVCDSIIVVDYQNAKTVEIAVTPASAAKGKTLHVESTSPMIVSVDRSEVTLDDEGKAYLTVSGNLPGGAALQLSLPEAELTADPQVQVVMHENVVRTPKASKRTGSIVEEGFLLTLTCTTPGAIIYYTTDGSCPCDEQARERYDGPIVIDRDMTINAIAVREGMEDSEVATFTYRVGDPVGISLAESDKSIGIEYVNGAFVITGAEGGTCDVYDMAGQLVASRKRLARQERIAFNRKGVYAVNVETTDGVTYAKKMVVR